MQNENNYFDRFNDGEEHSFVIVQIDITSHTGWLQNKQNEKYIAKKDLAIKFIQTLNEYGLHLLFWAGDGGVFVTLEKEVENYDEMVKAIDKLYYLFDEWKEQYKGLDTENLGIRSCAHISLIITDRNPSFWTSFDLNKIIKYERWITNGGFAVTEIFKDKLSEQKHRFNNFTKIIATKYGDMRVFPDSIYRVGFGEQEINPTSDLPLVGFCARTRSVGQVLDNGLVVQVLYLHDGKQASVIISYDSLGLDNEVIKEIKQKISKKSGLSEKDIMISASHTHSAPALMNYVPKNWRKDDTYVNKVIENTLNAFEQASTTTEQTILGLGFGKCDLNRGRCEDHKDIADPRVKVLKFETPTKNIIVFIYACHPVTLIDPKASPDFVGYARNIIQNKRFETKQTISIFLNGCAGNINPCLENGTDLAGKGEEAAKKVGEKLGETVIKTVEKAVQLNGGIPIINEMSIISNIQKTIDENTSMHPIVVQMISFAGVKIIGIAGEPFVETDREITDKFGQNIILVGYANENIGYIPSKEYYEGTNDVHKYWTVDAGHDSYGVEVPPTLEEQIRTKIESLICNTIKK